jgi:hypothetical protein
MRKRKTPQRRGFGGFTSGFWGIFVAKPLKLFGVSEGIRTLGRWGHNTKTVPSLVTPLYLGLLKKAHVIPNLLEVMNHR